MNTTSVKTENIQNYHFQWSYVKKFIFEKKILQKINFKKRLKINFNLNTDTFAKS